ncbi:MAG: hypothetical protein IKP00_13860 [Victivallales bacterium]|nr:hypothetical protein [Victivallales bacterium]
MKKILPLLLFSLLFCTLLMAREVITLPCVAEQPASMTVISPGEWRGWASLRTPSMPAPPFPYQAFGAYDDHHLYIAMEMELGRQPRAGQGCAIPWFSEGAEFRVDLPEPDKVLQLFADASGAAFLQRRWIHQPVAPIILRARATATGYSLFVAFPWNTVALDGPPLDKTLGLSIIPQVMERPLKFQRDKLVVAIKAGNTTAPLATPTDVLSAIDLNPEPHILNFGKPGYNSRELLTMLPSILDAHPKTAIVMIGTNDVTWSKKRLPAEEYEANVLRLLKAFSDNEVKTILVTMPPCIEEYVADREKYTPEQRDRLNAEINDFNARAKRAADKTGAIVVDYHACFQGDLRAASSLIRNEANLRSKDGVHPSAEGYRLLARLVADAIKAHRLPIDCIACCGDSITYGAHMNGQGTTTGETYPAFLRTILFTP